MNLVPRVKQSDAWREIQQFFQFEFDKSIKYAYHQHTLSCIHQDNESINAAHCFEEDRTTCVEIKNNLSISKNKKTKMCNFLFTYCFTSLRATRSIDVLPALSEVEQDMERQSRCFTKLFRKNQRQVIFLCRFLWFTKSDDQNWSLRCSK